MINPLKYYQEHLEKYQSEAKRLYRKMTAFSMYRLAVFLIVIFGVYMTFGQWKLALLIGIIGVAVFLILLSKYTDIKRLRDFNKALVVINEDEIKIASGHFHDRDAGLQFQDPNHYYSLDIDLFGRGSFFQFINRTTINEGTEKLAEALKANHTDNIVLRQQAIKELSGKPQWRQFYSATSSLVSVETPAKQIINWLQNHKTFLPKIMQWLPLVFAILTGLIIGLAAFNLINATLVGYWLFVGLGISGMYLKKITIL